MIRTIKRRIYFMSVLPLAMLAVALILFNGLYRIDEANRELGNAQKVTAELLNGSATEALVLGNTLNFEQVVAAAMKTSPILLCITLRDAQRVLLSSGECFVNPARTEYFKLETPVDDLSDFNESRRPRIVVGQLGISMSEENVVEKRRQVLIQFGMSLVLIAIVLALVSRSMRVRLIEPIQRIDAAMQALGQRNYEASVHVEGDDELARLAKEVNRTIQTIAAYTHELERHRNDAESALHDADEANMAREGLIRSLTEELEAPMSRMHAELTAIAIANHDLALKQGIKNVLGLLQDAEANFADLIEVASSVQSDRRSTMRELAEVVSGIRRDVHFLSGTECIVVNLVVTQVPPTEEKGNEGTGIFVDLDGARFRKALVYLIRAMAKRCNESGVHVSIELIGRSFDELHMSAHLTGFYARIPNSTTLRWTDELSHYANTPPSVLGWTEREVRVITYLSRTVGINPTFVAAPNGAVSIFLDTTCRFTREHTSGDTANWMLVTHPISATVVSDDGALARLTSRIDLANYEVTLLPPA